jgi:DNA processing protein
MASHRLADRVDSSSAMLRHWLQLAMTEGIGPILTQRLLAAAGSAEGACGATVGMLREIEGIGGAKATKIATGLRDAASRVDAEIERAQKLGIAMICPDDAAYPLLLRNIPDPPAVLYVRGEMDSRDQHAVAIVGSRKCSHYGREQADRFAALLAGAGFTVVSGGARGIDSAAHRGAMIHPSGRTVAVLGSGLDVPYPPENAPLFDAIAQGRGAVLSEYPLGTPPIAENFPRRNRIVSGMSRGVLVIEADVRSGALITARQACDDHGRPVFAVPGRVDNALSAGPHLLIREGAVLVSNLDDILTELGPLPDAIPADLDLRIDVPVDADVQSEPREATARPAPIPSSLNERQAAILATFDGEPLGVDQVIERSQLPANIVLQELTLLSLRGALKRVDGNTYAKR